MERNWQGGHTPNLAVQVPIPEGHGAGNAERTVPPLTLLVIQSPQAPVP